MDAAVVKLNALANPVRAGAQDYDLLFICRVRLALRFFYFIFYIVEGALVSGIQIRRIRLKLGGACVNAFIDRKNARVFCPFAERFFILSGEGTQHLIGKAGLLRGSYKFVRKFPFSGLFYYIR